MCVYFYQKNYTVTLYYMASTTVEEEVARQDASESVAPESQNLRNGPTPFDMYRFLFPNRALRRTWVERKWKQFEKAEAVQNEQHVKRWGSDLQTRVRNYRRYLDKIIRESYYIKRMCVRYNNRRRQNNASESASGRTLGSAPEEAQEEVQEEVPSTN